MWRDAGLNERIDERVLWWFSHIKRIGMIGLQKGYICREVYGKSFSKRMVHDRNKYMNGMGF